MRAAAVEWRRRGSIAHGVFGDDSNRYARECSGICAITFFGVIVKCPPADLDSEMDSSSFLNLFNTLRRLDLLDHSPKNWAKGKNIKEGKQDYIQRFNPHK